MVQKENNYLFAIIVNPIWLIKKIELHVCERSIGNCKEHAIPLNTTKCFEKKQCTKKRSSVVTVDIFKIRLYLEYREDVNKM
jgi:hypothetical protein